MVPIHSDLDYFILVTVRACEIALEGRGEAGRSTSVTAYLLPV